MKFNTIYGICLTCTLAVFFIASFILGSVVRAQSYNMEPPEQKTKVTSFTKGGYIPSEKESEKESKAIPAEEEAKTAQEAASQIKYYDVALTDSQQEHIFSLCEEYGVPSDLVFAVISSESSYRGDQISENGDWGIMQINAVNHPMLTEKLGVTDFLDFEQNTLCGVYMLSEYYHKYADISKIAMCYRYGENGAKEMWNEGIFETEYTREIVLTMATLRYR